MPYLCIKSLQLFYRLNSVIIKVSSCVHCVCVWVHKKYFKIYIETQKFKNMLVWKKTNCEILTFKDIIKLQYIVYRGIDTR